MQSNATTSSVSVKLALEKSRRRARLDVPLRITELQERIYSSFPEIKGKNIAIEYIDDEGDNILVSTDVELEEARLVYAGLGRVLSFIVSTSEDDSLDSEAPLPAVAGDAEAAKTKHQKPKFNRKKRHQHRRNQNRAGKGGGKGRNGGCRRKHAWRKLAQSMGLFGPNMSSPWANPLFRQMVQVTRGCVPHFHPGVTCDGSGQFPLLGTRYHKIGANYDLNEAEFEKLSPVEQEAYEAITYPGATPVPAAAHFKAHSAAGARTPCHPGVTCDGSGQYPLLGTRYHKIGANYDLNEAEFAKLSPVEQEAYEAIAYPGATPVPACQRASTAALSEDSDDLLPHQVPLSFGSAGPHVAKLQHVLIELGFMDKSAIRWRAGIYGPRTTEAVAKVAAAMGSSVSAELHGVFTAAIRTRLLELLTATSPDSDVSESDGSKSSSEDRKPALVCTFVQDLTVPDGQVMEEGKSFQKKWLIKTGVSGWPAGCSLTHVAGDLMGAKNPVVLEQQEPNSLVELAVNFTTPKADMAKTEVTSKWRVVDPDGAPFGHFLWATVNVVRNPTAAANTTAANKTTDSLSPTAVDGTLPLQQLVAMGFEPTKAAIALSETGGNVIAAVRSLIQ